MIAVGSLAVGVDTGQRIIFGVVGTGNVVSRMAYLEAAGSLFLRAPLTGVGIGGFAATGLDLYPHNLLAEVAAELGIVGVLVLAGWFIMAFRAAAGSPVLVALLASAAVFTLFSGSLAGNSEFWIVSGLAIGASRSRIAADAAARSAAEAAGGGAPGERMDGQRGESHA